MGRRHTWWVWLLLVLIWGSTSEKAFSAPAPGSGPAAGSRAVKGPKKPVVSLYWLIKSKYRAKTDELTNQVETRLSYNLAIKFKTINEILEPVSSFESSMAEAKRLAAEGEKLSFEMEFEKAAEKLSEAVAIYKRCFPYLLDSPFGTGPLKKALRLLAVAQHQHAQADASRKTLMQLMALQPDLAYKQGLFPEGMKETLLNLKLEMDERGSAPINVASKPGAAEVFLDGKRVGRTPMNTKSVKVGYHFVTFRRQGYRTVTKLVQVTPPNASSVEATLSPISTDFFDRMRMALKEMGKPTVGPGIKGAGQLLKTDILLLARAVLRGDEATVTMMAYDLRSNRLLKPAVVASMNTLNLGQGPASLVRRLFAGVRLDGRVGVERVVVPKLKLEPRVSAWDRFRRWKGFWPTVGGVVGSIVLAVTIGLAVGLTQDRRLPGGLRHTIYMRRSHGVRPGVPLMRW